MTNHARKGTEYAAFVVRVKQLERAWTCYRCGLGIDPGVRYPDPMSWSLEHMTPLDEGGELLDINNAAGSHFVCNSRHGRSLQDRKTSRAW